MKFATRTLAAAVLLDARSLQPVAHSVARIPTSMPYVPGLLSFRELPAVLQALRERGADLNAADPLGNSVESLARGEIRTR